MPTLNHYPPNLTDAELGELQIVANKFRPVSERLASWIMAFVEFEHARREAEKLADPIDVEQPKLNCARWTDGELLDAVWASFSAYQLMRDNVAAGSLMATVHNVLLLWTRNRFRNPADPDWTD
jgi:hypothetical protein